MENITNKIKIFRGLVFKVILYNSIEHVNTAVTAPIHIHNKTGVEQQCKGIVKLIKYIEMIFVDIA